MARIRQVSKEVYAYLRELDDMGYRGDVTEGHPPYYATAISFPDGGLELTATGETEEEALRNLRNDCDARCMHFIVRISRGAIDDPASWSMAEESVRLDKLQKHLMQLQAQCTDWAAITVVDEHGEAMVAKRADWLC